MRFKFKHNKLITEEDNTNQETQENKPKKRRRLKKIIPALAIGLSLTSLTGVFYYSQMNKQIANVNCKS